MPHRDMKSSNILLDENFEPWSLTWEFGLARIIGACETHVSTDIAGTFGYTPLEYGQMMKCSTRCPHVGAAYRTTTHRAGKSPF